MSSDNSVSTDSGTTTAATAADVAVLQRSRRATAGKRMSHLVGKAQEADDAFWGHDTWDDGDGSSGNESFCDDDVDAADAKDEFDSDFNDSETDTEEQEQEQEAKGAREEAALRRQEVLDRRKKALDMSRAGRQVLQKKRGLLKGNRIFGVGTNAGLVLNFPPDFVAQMAELERFPTQPTQDNLSQNDPDNESDSDSKDDNTQDNDHNTVNQYDNDDNDEVLKDEDLKQQKDDKPIKNTGETEIQVAKSKNVSSIADQPLSSLNIQSTSTTTNNNKETKQLQPPEVISSCSSTRPSTPANHYEAKAKVTLTSTSFRPRRGKKHARTCTLDKDSASTTFTTTAETAKKKKTELRGALTKAQQRRFFTQEELLLEAATMTEPENERWLLGRKRLHQQTEQQQKSLSNSSTNDATQLLQRYISKRGTLTTINFSSMDAVPEIFVSSSKDQKQTNKNKNDNEDMPRPRPPTLCVITGKPARYKDPLTKCAYYDASAFTELRRRHAKGEPFRDVLKATNNTLAHDPPSLQPEKPVLHQQQSNETKVMKTAKSKTLATMKAIKAPKTIKSTATIATTMLPNKKTTPLPNTTTENTSSCSSSGSKEGVKQPILSEQRAQMTVADPHRTIQMTTRMASKHSPLVVAPPAFAPTIAVVETKKRPLTATTTAPIPSPVEKHARHDTTFTTAATTAQPTSTALPTRTKPVTNNNTSCQL